ncbi:uncharacterized protein [Pyrus communis]|uniref:uncharacterized protein n=1 Tax=Pyrus communis TaxID=23211 RepID=UPI0035C16CA5
MDPSSYQLPDSNSNFIDQTLSPNFNEYPSSDPFVDLTFLCQNPSNSALSPSLSPEGDDGDYSDSVLRYINQVLMEEDMETKPCMFHDPLAVQAAEKSLFEVLGGKFPPSPNQHPLNFESPYGRSSATFSDHSGNNSSSLSSSTSYWDDSRSSVDVIEHKASILQNPIPENFVFQSKAKSQFLSNGNGLVGSYVSDPMVSNLFGENELVLQFNRGVEEARKFLPRGQLIVDVENNKPYTVANGKAENVVVKTEKDEGEYFPTSSRGKKSHEREDADLEVGRSTKQSAVYEDTEADLSEIFDKVLVCGGGKSKPIVSEGEEVCLDEANKALQQNGQSVGTSNGKTRAKKKGDKKEVIDLRTLLISCAQAVSSDDRRTANELLKQIRQHSSAFGDSSQRLAHCFANGLEARLAGTGTQIYTALSSKTTSAADMLKAYQTYFGACPFMRVAIIFADQMISKLAEKAETLHIIDFGILYGFQWPALIHCLSRRAGGPPKLLRITGIELPQSGFRPEERVQETGHRLAKYCERYNVPFEYNGIAKKWEAIQYEELKVKRDEVLAVNCLFRFKNLLDETVVVNSPRDAVLNLIRSMNPDIFIHSVVNGSYGAPFFVTRFREALFHFSALFDMFDTNISREDQMRLMFEEEFLGREVVNTVACEGSERVVRPETYKQWQVRNMRAGFKQLPLDRELMNKIRAKVKRGYHRDFMVDEDGNWMLQGWKGRIIYSSSCWVPSSFRFVLCFSVIVMDHPTFNGSPDYMNGFSIDDLAFSPNSTQFSNLTNEYQFNQFSPDLNFMDNHFSLPPDFEQGNIVPEVSLTTSGESFVPSNSLSPPDGGSLSLPTAVSVGGVDSSSDDNDFSEAVFKYVNQILLEENIEKKPGMFFDPLGLRVTEKSFYDVLGQQYPFSPNQQPLHINPNVESPDGNNSGSCGDCSGSNNSPSPGTSNSIDPQRVGDSGDQKSSFPQTTLTNDNPFQFTSHSSSQLSVPLENRMTSVGDGQHVGGGQRLDDMLQGSSVEEFVAQNIYTDSDSILQFQRGLEEASKFLPKSTQLLVDLESNTVSPEVKASVPMVTVQKEKSERKNSPNGSKGRKNREWEDVDLEEGRSSKQSAVYIEKTEESELSEMFDKVLLSTGGNNESRCDNVAFKNEPSKTLQPSGQPQGSNGNGRKARGKKQGKKKETVDLRNLLILCAQAVSTNDFRTTSELLKQVRQHASPNGDGSQRLAHFFANGLEARMAGTGTGTQKFYTSIVKRSSAVDMLKSYQVYLSACPSKRMCMLFKNKMILKMAEKATTLHIVDFGILYGFQWPILIQHLSKRRGGPPKLRITGIEVPQPGFRPAEWIEETGRRLARYCERFNVPFEYNAIASQDWESIQLEDLKTERNEVLAVNCMFRFKNLLDETVEVNCPRDAVLQLIRKMKPDIFVHSIINGSYNAPFFVTRFREALFHYSSLYDAFDINISRDNEERLRFESEFYGREAMNVIACEGVERVERPETYKQWQVRCMRAGLQPLQLDQDLVKILKDKVKAWYHKDFVLDQDSDWMIQGWKGRIVYASSCWVPA